MVNHGLNFNIARGCNAHVLVHFVKSISAYTVKSSSTLFSDNIQWNFKISFPCVRFNIQFGYNLITENWDHQKWDFCQTPVSKNWRRRKNMLACVICCFEKRLLGYLFNFIYTKIAYKIYFTLYKLLKPLFKVNSSNSFMNRELRTAI